LEWRRTEVDCINTSQKKRNVVLGGKYSIPKVQLIKRKINKPEKVGRNETNTQKP